MKLSEEFDEKWEKVKDQYPPDPAGEEAVQIMLDSMQMVRELEKITKRQA